jgi:hypothetical protein
MTLREQGLSKSEIARRVGCTPGNVVNTIKRELDWDGRTISALTERDIGFVVLEAEKHNVSPRIMARALLVDAIQQAMGE